MHAPRSEDHEDTIVDVKKRDVKRWNAAADVDEKGTLIAKAIGWVAVKVTIGMGFLLALKQYMGWGTK